MKKSWLITLSYLLYLGMHIYFAIYAFLSFKLWFAIVILLTPVVGDLLLCGASIGLHNWLPAIIFTVVATMAMIGAESSQKEDIKK